MTLKEKKYKYFFIFYIFLIVFKETYSEECPKDKPIKKNNICVLEYCSYAEYLNKICVLNNSIKKIQWLKDIRILGTTDFRHLSVLVNSDDVLILESSYDRSDTSTTERRFYGTYPNGLNYFYEIKTKTSKDFLTLNMPQNINRKASEILTMEISGKNNYILNLGSFVEIYDYTLEKEHTFFLSSGLFEESIFSERNALFKIDENQLLYGFISGNYFKIFYINFTDISLPDKYSLIKYNNETNAFPTYIVSCFDTSSNIICFYRNIERVLVAGIYSKDNLVKLQEDKINSKDCYLPTHLFFKCIHLKDDIGAFVYFTIDNSKPLLQIKKLNGNNLQNYLTEKNEIDINKESISISSKFNYNDLIRLNDTKFAFITVTDDDNVFYNLLLFIFELFDNDQKIENRLYKIPFNDLYGILLKEGIRGLRLNNNLGVGFIALNTTLNQIYTYFMFFSYPNGTDHLEPESKVCLNDNNRTIHLSPYLFIENNFFGLELKLIKILKLPNGTESGLYFYTKDESTEEEPTILSQNDLIGINDPIIIQITQKIDRNYSIEYSGIAFDPSEYDKFNQLSDGNFEDTKDGEFYNPKWYIGRKLTYNFSYYLYERKEKTNGFCCHEHCVENQCKIFGTDQENSCFKCKDGFYFNETEYFMDFPKFNNCISHEEGYWINKTHYPTVLSLCYETCKTCDKSGNFEKQNCLTCLSGLYKIENEQTGNCYDEKPNRYFLNENKNPFVYSKCNKACINCTNFANETSTNCEENSCNFDEDYFSYEADLTNCSNIPYKHYLDQNSDDIENYRWKPCHENCELCYGTFNASDMNCSKCINTFFPQNGTNNCYNVAPEHYFFNSKTKNYTICSENCANCNTDKDSCISCNNGTLLSGSYFSSHPFCQLECPDNYVFNPETLSCTTECPSRYYYKDTSQRLCINCYKYYGNIKKYYNLDNKNQGCIESIPDEYIYDPIDNDENYINFGIIEKCHSNCKTCSRRISKASENDQKCLTCRNNAYLNYGTSNCGYYCEDYYHHNYYVHDDTSRKCINCKKENINKSDKKIYKFPDQNECIDEQTAKKDQNFYIIDDNTGAIEKCHKNCSTCFASPDSFNNNCLTCDNSKGFYKMEYTSNCISPTPEGYYINLNTKEYKSCKYGCKTCSGSGTNENYQCLTCYDEFYLYSPKNACIYGCNGYYFKYDECLDISCFYYNNTNRANSFQFYYNPVLLDKCTSYCGNDSYTFENIYICLQNCSYINYYKNELFAIEKYNYLLNNSYLEMVDDLFYYVINNKNENEPKICYPQFIYIEKDNNNRIKSKENFTETYFDILMNKDEIELEVIHKLYQTKMALDFDYKDISYTLQISKDRLSFPQIEIDISYLQLQGCDINDIYFLKFDKRDLNLNSNYVYLNFLKKYEVFKDNETKIILKKENYSICNNFDSISYIIESPINLNNLPLQDSYYFSQHSYDIFDINNDFYNNDCEGLKYNGSDINLQIKMKYFYLDNITQENCVYTRINYIDNQLVETCYLDKNNSEYMNILKQKEERLSSIQNNFYYKSNNYHLKNIICYNQFISLDNISNFLFIMSAICFICKIVFLIIFHCRDVSPVKDILEESFGKRQITVQEERVKMVELKPPKKDKSDIISLNDKKEKKKYNYIVAVVKNEDRAQNEEKKGTLKEVVVKKRRHNIKNLSRSTLDDVNNDIEYFEYDVKMEDPPKQFREKKFMVDVNKIIYELKEGVPYENDTLPRFLLEHVPITNILFLSKNNTGIYRRFKYESHFLNALFFLTILSTLVVFNIIFFSDNLLVIKYENKKLPAGEYIVYSIYSALVNTVFGFLLIIIIALLQKITTKDLYYEEDFDNALKSLVRGYRCKHFVWQIFSIIFGLLSLYYLTIISNMYSTMRTELFVQILLSFIFENVFYCFICLLWWIFLKYIKDLFDK